jgi:N-sulfoglucosamine sulfohydrolase
MGIQYSNASSTAPHCSPARSTLITGCYATTFGMDILREDYDTPDDNFYGESGSTEIQVSIDRKLK